MHEQIAVGYHTFVSDGGEEFGAVRAVSSDSLTVYVENAGDFYVPSAAIRSVHDAKVVLDRGRLDQRLLDAIAHAHDREEPGA